MVLIFAFLLRVWGLSRGDTINDEIFYAFRAIGPLDFDKAAVQKTPLEWFDPRANTESKGIPWWTNLSFHDHSPLVFWVQHIFISIFGESAWAFRLPSVILGVLSIYLVYMIGALIFSAEAGLISASFLAVTVNNVFLTRTGLQEPYVIFFILLAAYLFLQSLKNDKYLIWLGVTAGLAMLTKYNSIVLAPIFFTYLLLYKRDYFKNKRLRLGALLAIIIFSPVIIYNAMLYSSVGHFDFQLSYIFKQNPQEWRDAPGKEIGTLAERFQLFIPRLIHTNSWLFLGLFAVSFLYLLISAGIPAILFITILYLTFYIIFLIGPAHRFLAMLTPWMAVAVGGGVGQYLQAGLARRAGKVPRSGGASETAPPRGSHAGRTEESAKVLSKSRLIVFFLAPILLFEVFYSYNNQIAYYPMGPEPWIASRVRLDNYNWGYNELDDYLERELAGKMPALAFQSRYQFLEDTQDKYLESARQEGLEPYPALITLYGNYDEGGKLWVLERLNVYHGWPIISFSTYQQYLQENGADYYAKMGFKYYYFITTTNIVPTAEFSVLVQNAEPALIKNPRGDVVFKVYKTDKI